MTPLCQKAYPAPPLSEREVLRYAGCREASEEVVALLAECREMAEPCLSFRACWRETDLQISGEVCDFEGTRVSSAALARNLHGCERAILFAATVGLSLDRLIARESRLSPARALLLQALGAERIEALCDALNGELAEAQAARGYAARPRFSPGYGDLPLSFQEPLFALLDCGRTIGLTLTGSGLMSPTKSVTAIIGLEKTKQ